MFGILSLLNILLFPVFLFGFVVLVCQLVSWGTARRISVSKVRKLIVKWRVPGPGSKMPLVEGCCVIFRSVGRRNHPWFLRGYREYHELLVNYSYLEPFLILETLPPIVSSVSFRGSTVTPWLCSESGPFLRPNKTLLKPQSWWLEYNPGKLTAGSWKWPIWERKII